jgi:hypothetical protein
MPGVDGGGMPHRHLAIAPLLLTLALGACGGDGPNPQPASTPTTEPVAGALSEAVPTTVAVPAAAATPQATVRTDDLEAELRAVDQELGGAEQSVNQANDTSPDRADD